jgi:hypothetical protein
MNSGEQRREPSIADEIDDIVEQPLPIETINWYLVAIVCMATAIVILIGAYVTGFIPSPGGRVNFTQTQTDARVKGNRKSRIYHVPGCKNYDDISPNNIEWFKTEQEAENSGYRKARNCS